MIIDELGKSSLVFFGLSDLWIRYTPLNVYHEASSLLSRAMKNAFGEVHPSLQSVMVPTGSFSKLLPCTHGPPPRHKQT
jgi:hypothetical protein